MSRFVPKERPPPKTATKPLTSVKRLKRQMCIRDRVVYYVYAYAKLLENEEIKAGEKINVTVPTGNFGNILAAYYAKQMEMCIRDRL